MQFKLLLSAVLVVLTTAAFAADPPKYNVLFLMSDDLRPELGCYGNAQIQTPNIDGLAKAGVRFDRAYCQYPLCNPSRSSIMTGRYTRSTGVFDNLAYFRDLHPDWVTLPQFFNKHGYPALRTGKIFHGTIDDTGSWTEGGTPRVVPEKGLTKAQAKARTQAKNKAQREGSDRIVVLNGDGESHPDYRTATQAI